MLLLPYSSEVATRLQIAVVVIGSHHRAFIDLVRSSDVLISKPGYGLVTESACNGVPIVLASRPRWPEETSFRAWLARHGRVLVLSEKNCGQGTLSKRYRRFRQCHLPQYRIRAA